MRKILAISVTAVTVLAMAPVAYANTHSTGGAFAACNADWYVNPDETALRPKQLRGGLLFDGPSLIHHQPPAAYTLKSVPTDGTYTATVDAGIGPLFKLETGAPYSTINKSATGKWWSSKIAPSAAGGQSDPVDSPADLIGKWNYTDATTIASFGVGYGNDTGNKALVSAVSFGGHVYQLTCAPQYPKPTPTPTPTSTDTGTPSPSPTESTPPGEAPAPTPVNSDLPVTG